MATQLRPVPEIATKVIELIDAMTILRGQIISAVTFLNVIDEEDVRLEVAKRGNAFDLTLPVKTNATPDKLAFLLDTQPVQGVRFTQIKVGAAKGASHRKVVTAKVVAP
jgi:hypothetical protein